MQTSLTYFKTVFTEYSISTKITAEKSIRARESVDGVAAHFL